ncbi:MAG: AMP-binding protein [Alphaproteobacteria bacterium]|nr:AMP-binding protein [Alphaproteobacteria bacterium]
MTPQTTIPQMFAARVAAGGDAPFLWRREGGGENQNWTPLSWNEVSRQVERLAALLHSLGVKDGDRVMLVSENRPEFLVADLAVLRLGAVCSFGFTTSTAGDLEHIVKDCEPSLFIVSPSDAGMKTLAAADAVGNGNPAVILPQLEVESSGGGRQRDGGREIHHWHDALGQDPAALPPAPEDAAALACLIYTSGTSQNARGVMLTHHNLLSNCAAVAEILEPLPVTHDDGRSRFLSFLPMSHSYELTAGQLLPLWLGAEIGYVARAEELLPSFASFSPTLALAVPRFYDLVLHRMKQGARGASPVKRFLFEQTLRCGLRDLDGALPLYLRPWNALLERLVRAKVRARFGGRLYAFVSGGGALNPETGRGLSALGLRILQGYGQTETSPVVSVNRPPLVKLHTAGPPLGGVEVKTSPEGEILVRGDLVMRGYWRRDDETREVLPGDGWLRTGDLGHLDADGHVVITGRAREVLVLRGGENVPPVRPEAALTNQPEIDQALALGDNRAYVAALIVVSDDWRGREGLDAAALHAALAPAVARANEELKPYERVRRYAVVGEGFSTENGLMTPTFKLRRARILSHFAAEAAGLFDGGEGE